MGIYGNNLIEDSSSWKFKKWLKDEFKLIDTDKEEKSTFSLEDLIKDGMSSEYEDEIRKRLEFSYEYKIVEKIEAKLTVTELKRRFLEQEGKNIFEQSTSQMITKPAFLDQKIGLSAAQKGTIQHFVMQHIDINKPSTKESILAQVDQMVGKVLLTKEQAECVNINGICNFLNTDICTRMRHSQIINKEMPFNLRLNPEQLGYLGADDEMILLQGIIDCYFIEEDGRAVLIDYKTDKVFGNPKILAKNRYGTQLEYYKRAIETIEGIKVKESYVYFFDVGALVEM